ncbi:hypothetical protein PLICRDRAFT_175053 [Plicaturopsis crispa FD-325 SS-3]|nr:hypothetical protein PLICRDRAFT_175053 [Plicaturopsis crispa FD-325 SS-3]
MGVDAARPAPLIPAPPISTGPPHLPNARQRTRTWHKQTANTPSPHTHPHGPRPVHALGGARSQRGGTQHPVSLRIDANAARPRWLGARPRDPRPRSTQEHTERVPTRCVRDGADSAATHPTPTAKFDKRYTTAARTSAHWRWRARASARRTTSPGEEDGAGTGAAGTPAAGA